MKNSITFVIPGACVPKERPRATSKIALDAVGQPVIQTWTYTAKRSKEYKRLARLVASNACQLKGFEPIKKPKGVKLSLFFALGRRASARPDIGNLANAIMDVLNGICYEDDSQVVILEAEKRKGNVQGTLIKLEEVSVNAKSGTS